MELKKQQILETAAELFVEKGYPNTSMQDIAETCNISKATLYKFFSAKEELGVLAIFYINEQMTGRVETVADQADLSPKEILRQSIEIRMDRFTQRNQFVSEVLFSLSQKQREHYLPIINRNRFTIFNLFCGIVKEAFQLDSEPVASELTLNLNGLIKEITFMGNISLIHLDNGQVADFMIDSLTAIQEKRAGKKSLLTQEQLEKMRAAFENGENMMRPVFRRKHLLCDLKENLAEYEKNGKYTSLKAAEMVLEKLKKLEESEEADYEQSAKRK